MTDFDKLTGELNKKRDELALQIKLGSMEAKKEWDELEKKFDDFSAKAQLDKTASGVRDALSELGAELTKGYERLIKAL